MNWRANVLIRWRSRVLFLVFVFGRIGIGRLDLQEELQPVERLARFPRKVFLLLGRFDRALVKDFPGSGIGDGHRLAVIRDVDGDLPPSVEPRERFLAALDHPAIAAAPATATSPTATTIAVDRAQWIDPDRLERAGIRSA